MDFAQIISRLAARFGSVKVSFNGTRFMVEYHRPIDGVLMIHHAHSLDECLTMAAAAEGFSHEKTHNEAKPFIVTAKTDFEFMAAWAASGRQYGDHELENVYLGWRMHAEFSHAKT